MGAISPVPFFNSTFRQKVEERIIQPTIKGLISEGIDYRGFIFAGLMNVNGEPYVIEYNARMGDPETQVVMPRLKTDLLELFQLAAKQELHKAKIEYFDRTAAAVILVSGGYPGSYAKGFEITGIDNSDNAITFHAGTCTNQNGRLSTSGGRVLASVGIESNIAKALSIAYGNAETIDFKGKYYRIDIGKDLI